ncbi:hypothetical protein [Caenispirillum bisanense]|uniref:Uncharacterized protein n=1 Tax=Caenispirillum bisanense TaxID=414052 RepID=A0A286G6E9_9PROT|nr:hypothetical protein [Caenispirillum bisanense]SOD91127.1 Protein of unknown function [Caenispirillum bisanense]
MRLRTLLAGAALAATAAAPALADDMQRGAIGTDMTPQQMQQQHMQGMTPEQMQQMRQQHMQGQASQGAMPMDGSGAAGMSPQVRQMHQAMGADVDAGDVRASRQVSGPDLLVGKTGRNTTTVIVTQRHAYPELFAAQVDGIARVGGEGNRQPIDPQAPVHQPD